MKLQKNNSLTIPIRLIRKKNWGKGTMLDIIKKNGKYKLREGSMHPIQCWSDKKNKFRYQLYIPKMLSSVNNWKPGHEFSMGFDEDGAIELDAGDQ
ncbi:MAG: hypothetical protein ACE5RP_00250 [Nitrosopumilus sp.]